MTPPGNAIEHRLQQLESHLEHENPVLLKTVRSFRELDVVARRMGLLTADESFATQIPWWPLISVLGTFSAGKSTFINHFLGTKLQRSGNQAVDDKFTVISFSSVETPHALPGVALDSDPRFPFYQISKEIEQVAEGEGQRIDAYLQLKTCPSEQLKGKIIIDSPGFDADAQRTSTLRITDYIIDLSDLVLVFFDARHPEPGAMRDTLQHLVANTINRPDSGKFLYILNQLDTTARENNPEDIIAAWQRALGEHGLTAGRFYAIYCPEAAIPIEDAALRARFETKRDEDLDDIHGRMRKVEIERAYRIVGALEKTARDLDERVAPLLTEALSKWRRRVLWTDAVILGLAVLLGLGLTVKAGLWQELGAQPSWLSGLMSHDTLLFGGLVVVALALLGVHHISRLLAAHSVLNWLRKQSDPLDLRGDIVTAFRSNTGLFRSIFAHKPRGWGRNTRNRLNKVLEETNDYIQVLNDRFTNPSGDADFQAGSSPSQAGSSSSKETAAGSGNPTP